MNNIILVEMFYMEATEEGTVDYLSKPIIICFRTECQSFNKKTVLK